MMFNMDTNISKWMYNLKSGAALPENLSIPGGFSQGTFLSTGSISAPQKIDLDKFEDGNYKEVLKRAGEKRINKQARVLSSCRCCLENSKLKEHEVLTVGNHFYTLQPAKTSFPGRHLLIVPMDHVLSSVQLKGSDELLKELSELKAKIARLFKENLGCSVLFYETAVNFNSVPHCRIEALAYSSEFDDQIPLFFEMAFRDLGSEWSTHQRAIKVLRSKGGLLKQIPDKFEYAYVEWGCGENPSAPNQ